MGKEMGGRFKREGTYVYLWLIHVAIWQKTTNWKILQEIGIPDHLTCLLRNLHDPEGWDGEGSGRQVQDGGHMYTHG